MKRENGISLKRFFFISFSFLFILAASCNPQGSGENDGTAPVAGASGEITTTGVTKTGLTLNWTAATDDTSAQEDLQYLAYYSESDNIDTVAEMEANGTAVGNYETGITAKDVSRLSDGTDYYFNVIAMDEAGNKTAYATVSETTLPFSGPGDYIIRWRFNNNGNDTAGTYDLSTENGSPVYSGSSPKEGTHCLSLDGNDSLITGSNYNQHLDSITIAAWIYLDSGFAGTRAQVIDIGGAGIYYDKNTGSIRGGPNSTDYAKYPISRDTWYHVVFIWDGNGNNVYLYIDGSQVDSDAILGPDISNIDDPCIIGRSAGGTDYWEGYIDDVIIYAAALGKSSAESIYNNY